MAIRVAKRCPICRITVDKKSKECPVCRMKLHVATDQKDAKTKHNFV